MRKVLISVLMTMIVLMSYASISHLEYMIDDPDINDFIIIEKDEPKLWQKSIYTISFYNDDTLTIKYQLAPEFLYAEEDTFDNSVGTHQIGDTVYATHSFESMIDSVYRVYGVYCNYIGSVAVTTCEYTEWTHVRSYDGPRDSEDYYTAGFWDASYPAAKAITVCGSKGDTLYELELSKFGFSKSGGDGSPIYTGNIVMLMSSGDLCIKRGQGSSIYLDMYRFFNNRGEVINTKIMKADFSPNDIIKDGEYYYLLNMVGDSIFLDKFKKGHGENVLVGYVKYVYAIDKYLIDDGNNITVFYGCENVANRSYEAGIVSFDKSTLKPVMDKIVPVTMDSDVLYGKNGKLLYSIKENGETYINLYDYLNDKETELIKDPNGIYNMRIINEKIYIITKPQDNEYKIYKLTIDDDIQIEENTITDILWPWNL